MSLTLRVHRQLCNGTDQQGSHIPGCLCMHSHEQSPGKLALWDKKNWTCFKVWSQQWRFIIPLYILLPATASNYTAEVNEPRKEGKQLKRPWKMYVILLDFWDFRDVISQTIGWKFKEILASKREKKKTKTCNLKKTSKTQHGKKRKRPWQRLRFWSSYTSICKLLLKAADRALASDLLTAD